MSWSAQRGATSATVALVALTGALGVTFAIALGTWFFSDDETPGRSDAAAAQVVREGQAREAAEKAALAFLDIDHTDMDARIEKMLDLSTGEFRKQYDAAKEAFTQVVVQGKATSVGEIKQVGIVESSKKRIELDVAADSTISTPRIETLKKQGKPVDDSETYRMRLVLELIDGRWLVSDLKILS